MTRFFEADLATVTNQGVAMLGGDTSIDQLTKFAEINALGIGVSDHNVQIVSVFNMYAEDEDGSDDDGGTVALRTLSRTWNSANNVSTFTGGLLGRGHNTNTYAAWPAVGKDRGDDVVYGDPGGVAYGRYSATNYFPANKRIVDSSVAGWNNLAGKNLGYSVNIFDSGLGNYNYNNYHPLRTNGYFWPVVYFDIAEDDGGFGGAIYYLVVRDSSNRLSFYLYGAYRYSSALGFGGTPQGARNAASRNSNNGILNINGAYSNLPFPSMSIKAKIVSL